MKTFGWILFAFFAIGVGLYPSLFFLVDMSDSLLATKSDELLADRIWKLAFYMHITFGGLSLITGWSQFSTRIRRNRINLHRRLGQLYLLCVILSGTAGLYLAFFATGGIVAQLGFGGLAISWLTTAILAYTSVRRGQIDAHQNWMIRCYALAFAAVTLRVYLPLSGFVFHLDFITSYRVIAWMCWVPNLIVAELIIRRIRKSALTSV